MALLLSTCIAVPTHLDCLIVDKGIDSFVAGFLISTIHLHSEMCPEGKQKADHHQAGSPVAEVTCIGHAK